MIRNPFFFTIMMLNLMTIVLAGCAAKPKPTIRLEAIPMQNAIGLVNANLGQINATLRATGTVDGQITLKNGKQRSFTLDGSLFYLAPSFLRFDLKKFGDRKILVGSNEQYYWYYSKEKGEYQCGRHDTPDDWPENIPVRADQLIEALGFSKIAQGAGGISTRYVQRIEDDYQQLLLITDHNGILQIEREYWLDRAEPRLLRRVIFRNSWGGIDMSSELSDYVKLSSEGPWLPRNLTASWPAMKTYLRFHVGRWKMIPKVGPDGPQFATPDECNR